MDGCNRVRPFTDRFALAKQYAKAIFSDEDLEDRRASLETRSDDIVEENIPLFEQLTQELSEAAADRQAEIREQILELREDIRRRKAAVNVHIGAFNLYEAALYYVCEHHQKSLDEAKAEDGIEAENGIKIERLGTGYPVYEVMGCLDMLRDMCVSGWQAQDGLLEKHCDDETEAEKIVRLFEEAGAPCDDEGPNGEGSNSVWQEGNKVYFNANYSKEAQEFAESMLVNRQTSRSSKVA